MKSTLINLATLILLMLVTGVFWGTWFTMTRSITSFSASEFIHIGKVIIANVANPMKVLMPLTILLLIVSTWMEYRKKVTVFYLFLVSLILMIITLLITVVVEVPIDNQIKTWAETTVPNDWESLRAKWAWYHALRTITSVASFSLFSLGSVMQGAQIVNQ